MANEVHELAVRLRPEGAEETEEAMDSAQESFEDAADTAEEESQRLSQFSRKLKGAMAVVVAGLGVAAAGILSKVPVIGEAVSGLEAILTSLALKIDEDLRPVLSDTTDDLFDLAKEIENTEGSADAFIKTLGGLGGIALDLNLEALDFQFDVGRDLGEDVANAILDGIVTAFTTDAVIDIVTDVLNVDAITQAIQEGDFTEASRLFIQALIPGSGLVLGFIEGFVGTIANAIIENKQLILDVVVATFRTAGEFASDVFVSLIKGGMNEVLQVITGAINKLIREANNRIPGVNLDELGTPQFERESIGSIAGRAGERFNRRIQQARAREEARDARRRQQEQAPREQNAFAAGLGSLRIEFGPEADKVLNAKVNQGPLNRGRQ